MYVLDYLSGDVVLGAEVHVAGMDGVHIESGAHDDVYPGAFGDSGESERVATDAYGGHLDDSASARLLEEPRLVGGDVHVVQEQVEVVGVVVVVYPAAVLERDLLVGHVFQRRDDGFAVHDPEVDEQVLVSGGRSKVGGFNWTEDGLDFACDFAAGHVRSPHDQSTRRNGGYTIANRVVRITSSTPLTSRASGVPVRSASAPNGRALSGMAPNVIMAMLIMRPRI